MKNIILRIAFTLCMCLPLLSRSQDADSLALTYLDEMPQFQGNLMQYLSSNIRYPLKARDSCYQGIVLAKFIVGTTGIIDSLFITHSVHPSLDAEAARIIGPTKWKPGMKDGEPVKVWFTQPIAFRIDDPYCFSEKDYYEAGEQLYEKGKYESAAKAFHRAFKMNHRNKKAGYNAAAAYITAQKKEIACDIIAELIRTGYEPAQALAGSCY